MAASDYTLQYDLTANDAQGNPMQVVFHGGGRIGFDTLEEAEAHKQVLLTADRELRRTATYEIRPVIVSDCWSNDFTVDLLTDKDGEPDDEPTDVKDLFSFPEPKFS